jgi:Fe-Mn family superoxide dismutase
MAFSVPDLAYSFDALEPYIDAQTMEIHHDKHHGAYVTNGNKAIEGTEWADKSAEEILTAPAALEGPLQPHPLLGDAQPQRRRRAQRRCRRCDRL